MATLYEIVGDELCLMQLLTESGGDISDPEVAEAFDQWFAEVSENLEEKIESYCRVIRELEVKRDARLAESKRIADMAATDKRSVDSMKARLRDAMIAIGREKIETRSFKLSVVRNGGKLPLNVDEDSIPEEYLTYIPRPDTDRIRTELEAGGTLPFASLGERGRNVRIR